LFSFLPQLGHLLVRRDSSGISLFYVLHNLISATEQFNQWFAFMVVASQGDEKGGYVVHNLPGLGDWINLAHIVVVWGLWLVVYVHPSRP
jgi:hypothetical protein